MTMTPTSAFMVGPHNLFDYNGLTFNDRSGIECYWVDDPQGFDSPGIRVSSTEDTEQDGSIPNPAFLDERTMTLSGWFRALNYPRLLEMGAALKQSAFALSERPLTVRVLNPASGYFTQEPVFINCRLADKPMIDMKLTEADLGGFPRRPFSVSLIASKPLFLSADERSETLYPLVAAFLGRSYPRGYDRGYTTRMDAFGNPTMGSNSLTLSVGGNYTAQPRIEFSGPLSGITLRNETVGLALTLRHSLLAGERLYIDSATGIITDALGVRRDDYVDPHSDDFMLAGGIDNEISLLVESFDVSAGSFVQINWNDSYL